MQTLATKDYIVFFLYFVIIVGYGFWIYNRKKKTQTSSNDYFLAEGSLTWWAIGASLIASNISAEQFIGMSGSGFKMGLAIATYEWMAAATLVIVAVFFMPVSGFHCCTSVGPSSPFRIPPGARNCRPVITAARRS